MFISNSLSLAKSVLVLFLLLLSISLTGCATTNFTPLVQQSDLSIGMDSDQFEKKYGSYGDKIYYSTTDRDAYLWVLNIGQHTHFLTGDPFFGGTVTTRTHFMVVDFDKNKIDYISL